VERGSLEPETLFSSAKSAKVLSGLWNNVWSQLHDNSSLCLVTGRNVKKDAWSSHFSVMKRMDSIDLIGFISKKAIESILFITEKWLDHASFLTFRPVTKHKEELSWS
jgi:hypothetical protein